MNRTLDKKLYMLGSQGIPTRSADQDGQVHREYRDNNKGLIVSQSARPSGSAFTMVMFRQRVVYVGRALSQGNRGLRFYREKCVEASGPYGSWTDLINQAIEKHADAARQLTFGF